MKRAVLAAVVLAVGCAGEPRIDAGDEAILETAYRWQIADLESRGQAAEVWFACGADGAEPSAEFLARFAGLGQPVRGLSASAHRADAMVIDRETGALGRILRARGIVKRADGKVEVAVEAYAAPEGADGATLVLERSGASWVVREVTGRWIS